MPQDQPAAGSGRIKMTFNFASAHQVLASVVGAAFATTLFLSAAIGPVSQFI
jgi:hypothetical protein